MTVCNVKGSELITMYVCNLPQRWSSWKKSYAVYMVGSLRYDSFWVLNPNQTLNADLDPYKLQCLFKTLSENTLYLSIGECCACPL